MRGNLCLEMLRNVIFVLVGFNLSIIIILCHPIFGACYFNFLEIAMVGIWIQSVGVGSTFPCVLLVCYQTAADVHPWVRFSWDAQ